MVVTREELIIILKSMMDNTEGFELAQLANKWLSGRVKYLKHEAYSFVPQPQEGEKENVNTEK